MDFPDALQDGDWFGFRHVLQSKLGATHLGARWSRRECRRVSDERVVEPERKERFYLPPSPATEFRGGFHWSHHRDGVLWHGLLGGASLHVDLFNQGRKFCQQHRG
jgi:hypothetical protein